MMMKFVNEKRIRVYPRLMLIAVWIIMGINLFLHSGWIGAFGQVIGGDFIMFYSTGMIYRSTPDLIYDLETQTSTQQSLVEPTVLPGYNPYMNPPFVALIYAILPQVSLPAAFAIWTVIAIVSVFFSGYWLFKIIPDHIVKSGLSYNQLIILILSFFPFIEGLLAGQNHWFSLLLVTGIVLSTLNEKWYLAGIFSGMLIYKPQFVIGFFILWLVWKNFKALFTMGIVILSWGGIFIAINGLGLFQTYSQLSRNYLLLPYIAGWPKYLLITFYGLLTSIFPIRIQPLLSLLVQGLLAVSCIFLFWLAYKLRNKPMIERTPALCAAILLPLIATPYALLHDMIIVIPAFILWARFANSKYLLFVVIATYLGTFLLTLFGALTDFAWVSLLTLGIGYMLIAWVSSQKKYLQTGIPR